MNTLTLLKYVGTTVAAASLLLGLYSKLAAGRWRTMTRLDWLATLLVIIGAVVGVWSSRLQDAERQRNAFEAAALTDLSVEWVFEHVPAQATSRVPPAACSSPDDQRRHADRREQLYPFLNALSGTRPTGEPVALVLSLDANAAHVLPFGLLDPRAPKYSELSWLDTSAASLGQAAATVDLVDDLDQCIDPSIHRFTPLESQRPRTCDMTATLDAAGDHVTLRWVLGRECVNASVDRRDGTEPKMKLPERITLLLLTKIGDLPFDPVNFAKDAGTLPWKRETRPVRDYRAHSELRLVARGSAQDAPAMSDSATYVMQAHEKFLMGGKGGGAEVQHDYPLVTRWTGERSRQ